MKRPVFRFQIAALASRDRMAAKGIVRYYEESDAVLKRYAGWMFPWGFLILYGSGLAATDFLLPIHWVQWAGRLESQLMTSMPIFGIYLAGVRLFFVNPRLQQLLVR